MQGTWTPLHADVLRSYSWSTNVAGRKRWRLLPPSHTHLVMDVHGREMAPDFFAAGPSEAHVSGAGEDEAGRAAARFPGLELARQHMIEVVQVRACVGYR
jgi:hypothetical protein